MKTSALIQSLARWISEIATWMMWRCFKAEGKPSLLLTGLPWTLLLGSFSPQLSPSPSSPRVFSRPSLSLSLSIWHPEMNRCCHRDSCSLSAFKQTVSTGITFTGDLPVWGEVISRSLLCPVRCGWTRPVIQLRNMTSHMCRPHAIETDSSCSIAHSNPALHWIIAFISFYW